MKQNGYTIVSDILSEGKIAKYLADVTGKGVANVAKSMGVTHKGFSDFQKNIAGKASDLLHRNVKVGSGSRLGKAFEKGLKTSPLTKAGNI